MIMPEAVKDYSESLDNYDYIGYMLERVVFQTEHKRGAAKGNGIDVHVTRGDKWPLILEVKSEEHCLFIGSQQANTCDGLVLRGLISSNSHNNREEGTGSRTMEELQLVLTDEQFEQLTGMLGSVLRLVGTGRYHDFIRKYYLPMINMLLFDAERTQGNQ